MKYAALFAPYLKALSCKSPAPGGGSAGSLSLCLGVSLVQMAVRFSIRPENKKKLEAACDKFEIIKARVHPYIDLDGRLFLDLLKMRGAKRDKVYRKLEQITFDLGRQSVVALRLSSRIKPFIKKSIVSDFMLGNTLVRAALLSSIKNLEANAAFFEFQLKTGVTTFKKYLKER